MDAKTRRDRIEQRVRADREVAYAGLAAEFDVSEMTIRRDVEALETLGVVRRVVGGAIALKGKDSEPSFETRVADAAEEKRHIADAVADLIGSSETLILDSGSTALAVAKSLRGRALGLTVVTPSLLAALELISEPATNVRAHRRRAAARRAQPDRPRHRGHAARIQLRHLRDGRRGHRRRPRNLRLPPGREPG